MGGKKSLTSASASLLAHLAEVEIGNVGNINANVEIICLFYCLFASFLHRPNRLPLRYPCATLGLLLPIGWGLRCRQITAALSSLCDRTFVIAHRPSSLWYVLHKVTNAEGLPDTR